MNVNDINEMNHLRRKSSQYTERWNAVGSEIWSSTGRYIGRINEPPLADLISRVHNLFIPMVNFIIALRKKLQDRRAIKTEDLDDE